MFSTDDNQAVILAEAGQIEIFASDQDLIGTYNLELVVTNGQDAGDESGSISVPFTVEIKGCISVAQDSEATLKTEYIVGDENLTISVQSENLLCQNSVFSIKTV